LYSGSAKVLTSHQTIYKLTLSSGTFSATSYTPNSAAVTVNIPTSTSHLTFNTIATYNGLGGIKPAYSTTGAVTLTTTSATYTNTPTIAARTTTSGKFYAVEVDVNGVPYVNVPWSNTNTTTTAASSDSTSKLYLIGATTQSSSGVTTYSNSSCYATNGTLYTSAVNTSSIYTNSLYSKTSNKLLLTCSDASTIELTKTSTATGSFTQITRAGVSRSWQLGREGAIIR
jgi:hypothetical protein